MTWQKWALVAWFTLGTIVSVASVGKPRKPLTAEAVAWSLPVTLGIIALVVLA